LATGVELTIPTGSELPVGNKSLFGGTGKTPIGKRAALHGSYRHGIPGRRSRIERHPSRRRTKSKKGPGSAARASSVTLRMGDRCIVRESS